MLFDALEAKANRLQIFDLLLKAGADPNVQYYGPIRNWHGATPLYLATLKGCVNVVQRLLEEGTNKHILCNGKKAIDIIGTYNRELKIRNELERLLRE